MTLVARKNRKENIFLSLFPSQRFLLSYPTALLQIHLYTCVLRVFAVCYAEGACTAGDGSCDRATGSMGAGFFNFRRLHWDIQYPWTPGTMLQKSHKVGRAMEGLSSNRRTGCPSLHAIHKWIECGAKLNLAKTPDTDVLKDSHQDPESGHQGAVTLLATVKIHWIVQAWSISTNHLLEYSDDEINREIFRTQSLHGLGRKGIKILWFYSNDFSFLK